jgi:hypothetical protein
LSKFNTKNKKTEEEMDDDDENDESTDNSDYENNINGKIDKNMNFDDHDIKLKINKT